MKDIIKVTIKILLIFTIFWFINSFILSVNNLIQINTIDINAMSIIEKTAFYKSFIPFLCIWILYIISIIFVWKQSDNISKAIVNNNDLNHIQVLLNYENVLSVGINILCLYFIIDTSPRLFSYISNYILDKTRFVDKDFLKEYTIRQILEMIGISIKIILSILLIKYKSKVLKFLEDKE
jgi:hypothetical protein